ncbi:MAG: enoyl-CoA hydratase/isomerase family protein [Sporichthyaceae bacterium]
MTEYATINVVRDGGVEHIELNRPQVLNAWNDEFSREMTAAVQAAGKDPEVRAVLITGAGRGFSAGADLSGISFSGGVLDLEGHLSIHNLTLLAVRECPKPVVAGVHGAAAGIGASLVLACDLVVAAESSYLLMAFVNIGLMPDGGALSFLAERVGLARAAEMAMLGERLPAAKALDWGLINSVHPDADLPAAAMALAQRLAAAPTVAVANIKRTLRETAQSKLTAELAVEAQRQQEHAGTADFAEGVLAFQERRPARFLGR